MSNTILAPVSRAIFIALRCAAAVVGVEKCVPVTTIARARRKNAGSTSLSSSAMSAQSVR